MSHDLETEDNWMEVNERPTFLTVLCIITFIVSGLLLISTVYSTITYSEEKQRKEIASLDDELDRMYEENEEAANMMASYMKGAKQLAEESMANYGGITILNLLSIFLSIGGAILMYRLRRTGFYMYVFSKVVGFSVYLIFFTINPAVTIMLSLFGIFTIAFIVMYGVNLKHMK